MIVMLDGSDEVWGDFPPHDILVYSYESGSYEGSGFAAWMINGKFYYGNLSH